MLATEAMAAHGYNIDTITTVADLKAKMGDDIMVVADDIIDHLACVNQSEEKSTDDEFATSSSTSSSKAGTTRTVGTPR
jgi:hypothetical protein